MLQRASGPSGCSRVEGACCLDHNAGCAHLSAQGHVRVICLLYRERRLRRQRRPALVKIGIFSCQPALAFRVKNATLHVCTHVTQCHIYVQYCVQQWMGLAPLVQRWTLLCNQSETAINRARCIAILSRSSIATSCREGMNIQTHYHNDDLCLVLWLLLRRLYQERLP